MKLTLRAMIELLQSRRGPTTRALDVIFTPPYDDSAPGFEMVGQKDALDSPLQQWGIDLVFNAGGTLAEVLHINSWPNFVKEQLRVQVLAPSVQNDRRVRFFWEPKVQPGASYDVVAGTPGEGDVDVVFRTPWSSIVQTSVAEVDVGVGT